MTNIFPVVLSGGSGSRLWPLSRDSFPKQLLRLTGEATLLQQTGSRVRDSGRFGRLTVIANADHRFAVAEQLREVGVADPRIVLEPQPRNTAPAVTVAALLAVAEDPDAQILVMPSDHLIPDEQAFLAAVERGLPSATKGRLMLFGIQPDHPATGYGYIRGAAPLDDGAREVERFVEKPDQATAEALLQTGEYYWNSGIFLLPAATLIEEVGKFEPEVLAGARAALGASVQDADFLRLDAAGFASCPSVSLDHGVLERTALAGVVPSDFAWSDVGSWASLWELSPRDEFDNASIGDVLALDTRGSYLRSEGPLIAAIGVEDMIVVATGDAVLIARKGQDQAVKQAVETLKKRGHQAAVAAPRVHRPWGWYESVNTGERFQVKRIHVTPGGRLSLQRHHHRSEHWVVVNGTASVVVDGEERLVSENQSTYIPLGSVHRLSNPGKVPLTLIEVQSGAYLGEDDIVRIEDIYART